MVEIMSKRMGVQEYMVAIVNAVAARGTCDRGTSGAVIVKDNQIISTGYVGSASGDEHCDDVGHMYEYRLRNSSEIPDIEYAVVYNEFSDLTNSSISQHCVRTIHAEQNAICQAAKHGHSVNGATIYCSMVPCRTCAMMIVNSGIIKVVALKEYQISEQTKKLFKRCGVELAILDPTLNSY